MTLSLYAMKCLSEFFAPYDSLFETRIICKKYWKNCVSYEKVVTTSEILTEYTTRSCTTIASNNCRF